MTTAVLKVALIGAGRMAAVHAASIRQHPRASLAVIADPVGEAAAALAGEGATAVCRSLDEALDGPAVDAVVIASPSETHAGYIEACAARGLPVLCEKPVDLSLARVDRCLETVSRAGVPVVIGFHRRFDTARLEVWKAVQDGEVGELRHVLQVSRDPRLPHPGFLAHSGGIVRDMLIHDLDELLWLVGDKPVTVNAELRRTAPQLDAIDDHDLAAIGLSFEGGPQCHVCASRQCDYGFDQRLEVFGSRGLVACPSVQASAVRRADATGFRESPLLDHFPRRYASAYRLEFDHFVRVVRGEESPRCTIEDARRSLALAELVLESHRTRAPARAASLHRVSTPPLDPTGIHP